ncbi:MAG: pyridoxamine 5'-phosphate oxidase family protein [Bacteroidetes bacterium]|nr:pyridoxamine 5'-phosphate oxidase family protein [Bacteroidota bacterium]
MAIPKKIKVTRVPKRGHYDKETIYSVLDEGYLCHVGFMHEGYPVVIPTMFGREGNKIYIHGSSASRMMKDLERGIDVCITITNVHGIVLARSAYHHSMNYGSVVLFGKAMAITETDRKVHALKVISDHLILGRWDDVRPPSELELKATMVLEMEIDEASAKIRTGDPGEEKEDYTLNCWAGILPLNKGFGAPIADSLLRDDIPIPDYIKQLVQ